MKTLRYKYNTLEDLLAGYSVVSDKIWHWMRKYPYRFEITLDTKKLTIIISIVQEGVYAETGD